LLAHYVPLKKSDGRPAERRARMVRPAPLNVVSEVLEDACRAVTIVGRAGKGVA
jgi:hypothetical protein